MCCETIILQCAVLTGLVFSCYCHIQSIGGWHSLFMSAIWDRAHDTDLFLMNWLNRITFDQSIPCILFKFVRITELTWVLTFWTRMHSSRMRTIRCSGHLSCHAHPPDMHAPLSCMHTPLPHMPPCQVCPLPHLHPSIDRMNDTRLWKHYLSTTTLADGNKYIHLSEQ